MDAEIAKELELLEAGYIKREAILAKMKETNERVYREIDGVMIDITDKFILDIINDIQNGRETVKRVRETLE